MARTIVLHPGALGDVLLAIPALRALRAGAPDAEIVLAAQPRIGRLLTALGSVDQSLDFDTLGLDTLFIDDMGGLASGPPTVRAKEATPPSDSPGPDARDAPARPWRPSKQPGLLAGARVVSWFGSRDAGFVDRLRSIARESVVASTIPTERLTVWEHLLASVATFTAGEAERDPIALDGEIVAAGRRALVDAGCDGSRPLVMLHPGAGGAAKRWPVEGFAEVAARVVEAVDAEVVVHEGPADHDVVAALRARVRVPMRELVDPSLPTLAGVMRHATLVIGNDSGVTHLAAAVGAPTLALFVAANLPWRPWSRHAYVRVVNAATLTPSDVDAVVTDAMGQLQMRPQRAGVAQGHR